MKIFSSRALLLFASIANAVYLNLDDTRMERLHHQHQRLTDIGSIRAAAALAASGARELYKGDMPGGSIGKWPFPPYYWWESGGAWGSMLQYHIYTGDVSYGPLIHQALVSQLGPSYDFINQIQFKDTGNDDQAFWILNAMTMAEYGYPNPPLPAPAWLTVVQNAYTQFVERWNMTYCNGGLKWQFHAENLGFNYKQTISNGAFFQITARLARFTGDPEYLAWAEKIWQWSREIGLIDEFYNVYDGSDELVNCSGVDHHQWSYNLGVFLYGSAILSNYTSASSVWVQRTVGLLDAASTFFTPFLNSSNILFEAQCEFDASCNTDQQSMKAYMARWLANTALVAPYTANRIRQFLRASAIGAASSCTGGPNGKICGTKWYVGGFDGQAGLGQQIAAAEVFAGLLFDDTRPPGTQRNVHIGGLPAMITSIAPASTGLAKPLHDRPTWAQ